MEVLFWVIILGVVSFLLLIWDSDPGPPKRGADPKGKWWEWMHDEEYEKKYWEEQDKKKK